MTTADFVPPMIGAGAGLASGVGRCSAGGVGAAGGGVWTGSIGKTMDFELLKMTGTTCKLLSAWSTSDRRGARGRCTGRHQPVQGTGTVTDAPGDEEDRTGDGQHLENEGSLVHGKDSWGTGSLSTSGGLPSYWAVES